MMNVHSRSEFGVKMFFPTWFGVKRAITPKSVSEHSFQSFLKITISGVNIFTNFLRISFEMKQNLGNILARW